MKLIDVHDGGLYEARVSGRLVPVRVLSREIVHYPRLKVRLTCRNTVTMKTITCTAQRLRRPLPEPLIHE